DRLHSADIDEKGNEFPTAPGKFLRPRQIVKVVGEEFRVVHPQHTGTRTRGGDDIIIAGKRIKYLQGNRFGIGPVTGVVRGLTATGLAARDLDRASCVFEQFHSRKTYSRPEQIDQTRNKERYMHPLGSLDEVKARARKLGPLPRQNQSERAKRPGARRRAPARGSRR